MVKPNIFETKDIIRRALLEDIGPGDVTSRALIPADKKMNAKIVSKEAGVVAGVGVAKFVFEMVDKRAKVVIRAKDGAKISSGKTILEISGPARSILTAERTALNFLQRMSGIATLTRQYVEKVKGIGGRGLGARVKILSTRKTVPGLRALDKYAVSAGGGLPHRMGLYDAILIKENHVDVAGGLKKAVALARKNAPRGMKIEVEARTIGEVRDAVGAGVDTILLDNMSISTLKKAVKLISASRSKIQTEASGGVSLSNVRAIAKTGVDMISIGSLTHSPRALDVGLDVES